MHKPIIFICGNGNITFEEFEKYYINILKNIDIENYSFILGDFRGTDTLTMEYLKDKTSDVEICHLFNKPRYTPDKFKTLVNNWEFKGGFKTNEERDYYMIRTCTYFIAYDKNTDENRTSGTFKNIELCKSSGKCQIVY